MEIHGLEDIGRWKRDLRNQVSFFELSDKCLGVNGESLGTQRNPRFQAFFFCLQVATFFLIFFFAITSCAKSMSEQLQAQILIHTFNHSAKDSKKAKQLHTEML